ncbi:MAG: hypothetical protein WDZ89_04100 [Gemmatimonadota bacterium]
MKCEVAVFCFALLLGCQPAELVSVASDGVPEMDADQLVIGFEHVQTQEGCASRFSWPTLPSSGRAPIPSSS